MSRLNLEDTVVDAVVKLSEGNPGAVMVLTRLFNVEHGVLYVCALDDMEIYGSRIWIAYKDVCEQDLDDLIQKIKNRSIKTLMVEM